MVKYGTNSPKVIRPWLFYSFIILIAAFLLRRIELGATIDVLGYDYNIVVVTFSMLGGFLFPAILLKRPSHELLWFVLLLMWSGLGVIKAVLDGVPFGDAVAALILFIAPIMFYFLVRHSTCNINDLIALENIFLIAATLVGVLAFVSVLFRSFFEFAFGWGIDVVGSGGELGRATLPFGGANLVAGFLVLIFPLLVCRYMSLERGKNHFWVLSAIISVLLGILSTFSRGPIAILFIEVLLLIFTMNVVKIRKKVALFIVVISVLSIAIFQLDLLDSRVSSTELSSGEDWGSMFWRATTYVEMLRYIRGHALIGSGPSRYFSRIASQEVEHNVHQIQFIDVDGTKMMDQSHSQYLLIAFEYGLPGLLFFLIFIGSILRQIILGHRFAQRNNRSDMLRLRGYIVGILALSAWLTISDALSLQFRFSVMFWVYVGLGARISKLSRNQIITDDVRIRL